MALASAAASASYKPRVVGIDGAAGASAAAKDSSAGVVVTKRKDGRHVDAFRPTHMSVGDNSQASGSATLEIGDTKVLCSVFGPRAYTRGSLQYSSECVLSCDVKYAPFATEERREPRQQDDERQMSVLLQQALNASVQLARYPKSELSVTVLVLQDDGGAFAAAISCASLALANANVELFDLVASCSVMSQDSTLALDPTHAEHAAADATTTMALMPSAGQVTYTSHSGQMAVSGVADAMSLCLDGCATLYAAMRKQLIDDARARAAKTAASASASASAIATAATSSTAADAAAADTAMA